MTPESPISAVSVAQLARRWLAGRQAANRLLGRWAELETQLMRSRGDSDSALTGEDRSEVREMGAIDRRFDRLSQRLDRMAVEIAGAPAQTVEGGLLKIEIALSYTDPAERREPPWSLIESALTDLRATARAM